MMKEIYNVLKDCNSAIVFHHNDADGRSSAAVTLIALENTIAIQPGKIKLRESDYSMDIDFVEESKGYDCVLFVDFTCPPEVFQKIKEENTDKCIIIDHHISSYDKYKEAGVDYHGIIEVKKDLSSARSGVKLCHLYLSSSEPLFIDAIECISRYDSWAWEALNDINSLHGAYALMYFSVERFKALLQFQDPEFKTIEDIVMRGKIIYNYLKLQADNLRSKIAFETKIKGYESYKVLAACYSAHGSMFFGSDMDKYDICCLFYLNQNGQYSYSLYSKPNVDVSEIATSFGGGGHKGAAGFTLKKLIF